MQIIRPECPELAIRVGLLIADLRKEGKLTAAQSEAAFQGMLMLQRYRFVKEIERSKLTEKDFLLADSFVEMRPMPLWRKLLGFPWFLIKRQMDNYAKANSITEFFKRRKP